MKMHSPLIYYVAVLRGASQFLAELFFSLAPGFSPVMTFANHWEAVSTRILHWNGLDFSFCAVGWRVDEHLGRLARWTKK